MSDNCPPPRVPIERVMGWIEYLRANRERIHDEAEHTIRFLREVAER